MLYPNQMAGQTAAPMGQPGYAAKQSFPTITCDIDALPNAKTGRINNSYAIVIGVEQYRQGIPRADYATHDAEMMSKYLTRVMGYPEENVVTLLNENALRSDFEKYFERWLANTVERTARCLFILRVVALPMRKAISILCRMMEMPRSLIRPHIRSRNSMQPSANCRQKKSSSYWIRIFSGAGSRSIAARGNRPLGVSLPGLASVSKNIVTFPQPR